MRSLRPTFTLKRGDSFPVLVAKLREAPGRPMDLEGVESVTLTAQNVDNGETVLSAVPLSLEDAEDARYVYEWTGAEFAWTGRHQAVVRVQWLNGQRQTLPTKGYIRIDVEDEL